MERYTIEYSEIQTAYFEVDADSPEEALRRFEEWRIADEQVYITISNTDNITSEAQIVDFDEWSIDDEDILTDERYNSLYS